MEVKYVVHTIHARTIIWFRNVYIYIKFGFGMCWFKTVLNDLIALIDLRCFVNILYLNCSIIWSFGNILPTPSFV